MASKILQKDDDYYKKSIIIKRPKSEFLTNKLDATYPISLYVALNYKIFPNKKFELENGSINIHNFKFEKLHWGQRKLLMTEIDFLTDFSMNEKNKKVLVVYAGAADGKH